MSITETLKTTDQQAANTAADAATKQAQQQIDKAAGGAKKQVATAKQTVDAATNTLTKATDVGQLKQGLTTTAVSAATSQLPSAVQPITNMAAQQVASTVGTLGALKQKPDIAAKQLSQPITKTIEGTRHSTTEASTKPARRIGAIIRIGNTDIEEFTALEIHENYGTHHIMLLSVPSPNIKVEKGITLEQAAKLVGEPVEITLTDMLDKNSSKHELKMLVTNIQVEQAGERNNIIFTGQSPICILDAEPNFETFCDKDFNTTIKELCKPLENISVKTKIKSNVKGTLPFVCRYNETRFGFIKRMSNIYKQWCYFNGKELIIGEPENGTPIELVYNKDCRYLRMNMQLTSVNIGYYDYNAETHQFLEHSASEENLGKLGLWGTQVLNKSKKIFTNEGFVYNPTTATKETLQDIAKANMASRAAGMFQVTGKTDNYNLRIGTLATIQYNTAPEEKDKMALRVTGVTHYLRFEGTYENEFSAIPAGAAAPPLIKCLIPQPSIMEAIVVDTEDPKGQGRVKVSFVGPEKTRNQRLTNWIRVATPDAGGGHEKVAKNAGLVLIPEKGSHVLIACKDNDPHCPYVTSAIFHSGNATGSGKGNNEKSLKTKSGNTITLNDKDGSVTITDPKGAKVVMKGDGTLEITAPDKIDIKSKVIALTAENDVNIDGKNVKVDGKEKAEFNSSTGKTTVSGKTETSVTSDATVKVKGVSVEEEATLAMKIKGTTVDVEGSGTTNIKGNTMLALN